MTGGQILSAGVACGAGLDDSDSVKSAVELPVAAAVKAVALAAA